MASNVLGFLKDKNILVTGSTGFLGKIFMEKILRTQPGIKCIYVLLRAEDVESAKNRFEKEVMRVELFKILREQHGDNFESFIFQKVVPVVGDVAADHNLGIDKETTREHLWENLDAIVNNAASTVFDDRYDISLNINTKGAKNMVEFAKRCRKLQILLHVSTAYVLGRVSGRIMEKPVNMRETITAGNGTEDEGGPPLLDIKAEFDLLEKTLASIHMDSSTTSSATGSLQDSEAKRLKELGLERSVNLRSHLLIICIDVIILKIEVIVNHGHLNRARKFGWPNTYSFTKAMGDMLLENTRGNLPVVVLRPSIIESTLAEPFPGWMEGTRTMDSLIAAYGKGRLTSFLADPNLILDVIPADMVVNAMIVAMASHASENGLFIYHSASSIGNPLHSSVAVDAAYNYFSEHPCVDKDGNIVHVKAPHFLESMRSFRGYMYRRYKAPLQVLGLVDSVFCNIFREYYSRMLRNYNFAMYLAELYEPYVFFEGRFDITNTEGLWRKISAEDRKAFNFDVKCIDWADYFSNVHIPGLVKYVLK